MGRRPSTISKIFPETALPMKLKFYVGPPWVGGTKFVREILVTCPYMVKTLQKNSYPEAVGHFSRNVYVALGTPAHHSLRKL